MLNSLPGWSFIVPSKSFVDIRAKRGISAPEESRPLFIPELNHPRRIEGVVLSNVEGLRYVPAKAFVDATPISGPAFV